MVSFFSFDGKLRIKFKVQKFRNKTQRANKIRCPVPDMKRLQVRRCAGKPCKGKELNPGSERTRVNEGNGEKPINNKRR